MTVNETESQLKAKHTSTSYDAKEEELKEALTAESVIPDCL